MYLFEGKEAAPAISFNILYVFSVILPPCAHFDQTDLSLFLFARWVNQIIVVAHADLCSMILLYHHPVIHSLVAYLARCFKKKKRQKRSGGTIISVSPEYRSCSTFLECKQTCKNYMDYAHLFEKKKAKQNKNSSNDNAVLRDYPPRMARRWPSRVCRMTLLISMTDFPRNCSQA